MGFSKKPFIFYCLLFSFFPFTLAGESSNTFIDSYDYDFFQGHTAIRPYLNYYTLSDNERYEIEKFKLYDIEFFSSYNSTYPYGQNDKALWQGRGLNSSFSTGFKINSGLFQITFKPQIVFSQNVSFNFITPAYIGEPYQGNADTFGYYGIQYLDAPQRFGDDPFYKLNWGESEIRFLWKSITIGFGTQSVWLGPAKFNPILFSFNAPPFPKLDIGIRRTEFNLFNTYLGDIEGRVFWGRLSESEYFDTIDDNNYRLINALSFSYNPSFATGLVLGFHRSLVSRWEDSDFGTIFTLLNPFMSMSAGKDERDQRASITVEYSIPQVGFELYLEWARNDYSPDMDFILRYPFHTQAYTFGMMKKISSSALTSSEYTLFFEMSNIESSRDYEIMSRSTTFYAHHIVTQGYTNEGQWLGAGMGTGGNSQIVGILVGLEKSRIMVFLQRRNPDNDYVWFNADSREWEYSFRTELSLGIKLAYRFNSSLSVNGGFVLSDTLNYYYEKSASSTDKFNSYIFTSVRLSI